MRYSISVRLGETQQIYCVCESFTSDEAELIPAIDIVDSKKKDNYMSMYEHFIHVCVKHGIGEETVRTFLEYQILTDFVLTNTDHQFEDVAHESGANHGIYLLQL